MQWLACGRQGEKMSYWALMERVEDLGEHLLGYVELPANSDYELEVVINPSVPPAPPFLPLAGCVSVHDGGLSADVADALPVVAQAMFRDTKIAWGNRQLKLVRRAAVAVSCKYTQTRIYNWALIVFIWIRKHDIQRKVAQLAPVIELLCMVLRDTAPACYLGSHVEERRDGRGFRVCHGRHRKCRCRRCNISTANENPP